MAGSRQLGIARAQLRVLTLRFDADDLARLDTRHLVYGLLVTWAAGIGRYWDHPDPYALQSLGLGSLLVMGALGLLIYGMLWPLRPDHWTLKHLYTFLSLTALPALLYAIPVERFLALGTARRVNVWFLAIVALWRVLLLGRYLKCRSGLSGVVLPAALLLPLALVVTLLTALNLEKAVFDVMSGLREEGTANDGAYFILFLITWLSVMGSPLLVAVYGFAVWSRRRPEARVAP